MAQKQITLKLIQKANKDSRVYGEVYKSIFYDEHGSPKLRKWLVKRGVRYNDLNMVESKMNIAFVTAVNSYVDDKIPFEKYVWTKFKFTLSNYFYRKLNVKKIANRVSLEEEIDNGLIVASKYDFANIEIKMDINIIIKNLPDSESFIIKCKIHNDWSDLEIMEYLQMSKDNYKIKKNELKRKLMAYILEGKI